MARSTKEWQGRSDDAMPPPRVRLRILERYDHRCYLTGREIRPGDEWHLDHRVPLILGGANTESNLAPVLADVHRQKTAAEMKVKSKIARVAKKHTGIHKPKSSLSHPRLRKKMNGQVVDKRTGEPI